MRPAFGFGLPGHADLGVGIAEVDVVEDVHRLDADLEPPRAAEVGSS